MDFELSNFSRARPCWSLTSFACVFVLISLGAQAAEPSPAKEGNDDVSGVRFTSPDGKYGLLVTKDPQGDPHSDRVELIEVETKRPLAVLSDPDSPERSEEARLDWSEDSKKVAAYTATRVSGFTRIFVRDGDRFVEVKLPNLPDLPNPEDPSAAFRKKHKFQFLKWVDTGSLEFVRWLESGGVELRYHNLVLTKDGRGFRSQINAAVAIDSKNRARLRNVVGKKAMSDRNRRSGYLQATRAYRRVGIPREDRDEALPQRT